MVAVLLAFSGTPSASAAENATAATGCVAGELLNGTSSFDVFDTVGSVGSWSACAAFAKYTHLHISLQSLFKCKKVLSPSGKGDFSSSVSMGRRGGATSAALRPRDLQEQQAVSQTGAKSTKPPQVRQTRLPNRPSRLSSSSSIGVTEYGLAILGSKDLSVVLSDGTLCMPEEHGIPPSPTAIDGVVSAHVCRKWKELVFSTVLIFEQGIVESKSVLYYCGGGGGPAATGDCYNGIFGNSLVTLRHVKSFQPVLF